MNRTLLLSLCLLLPPSTLHAQEPGPDYHIRAEGVLTLALPESFARNSRVRNQLDSGLTTTLLIRVEGRTSGQTKLLGGCRIDVRYEPWDQFYFIKLWNQDGSAQNWQLTSFEELIAWFKASHPRVLRLPTLATVWELTTNVQVLPFSEQEMAQTQQWFHEHLGNQSEEKRDPNKVLDMLFASAIKRKVLIRYDYHRKWKP